MDLHPYILSSAELSDLQPKTITLSKQSSTKSFTADERVQPAADIESQNGFSEHLLVFFLNDVPNLVQQFEGKIYEAEAKTGDIALVPAGIPQRWIWTGVANTLHLRLAVDRKLWRSL